MPEKRNIAIVTACRNASGTPDFALTEVEVTPADIANGVHYYLAEADLLEAGYEEPFAHFDEDESPAFLHPAVRQYLDHPRLVTNSSATALMETT